MPFFLIPIIAGLGGLFVGSQVDNAVQSKMAAPVVVDQSKAPWYVTLGIWALVAFVVYTLIKKNLK
jgi:ABC-type thiamin/hydroxymethylpyrimidine transport system permease subunit